MSKQPPTPQNLPKNTPPKRTLSSYIFTTLLIFAIITALYSAIGNGSSKKNDTVGLSEVAQLVGAGTVKTIVVDGQDMVVTKTDDSVVKSKNEPNASLVDTLNGYGVPADKIAAVDISVASQSGFASVLFTLLPIILPIALIVFFF